MGSTVWDCPAGAEWWTPELEWPALSEWYDDDFEDHYITIHFREDGSVIGLVFDICDTRVVCLACGNGIDCCVCD
mgnify:FL=1|jgi:hypothetical protein